jgi:hypothetical protein
MQKDGGAMESKGVGMMNSDLRREEKRRRVPEVFSVVVECRDEEEQREMFERLRVEGRKVRLLVL